MFGAEIVKRVERKLTFGCCVNGDNYRLWKGRGYFIGGYIVAICVNLGQLFNEGIAVYRDNEVKS